MSNDYLAVEYDPERRPLTSYPSQLARHLAQRWGVAPGSSLLDVASGRAEVAAGFVDLGISVTCLDVAESGATHAAEAGAHFIVHEISEQSQMPFADGTFDVVYSKSFIEHIHQPVTFLADVARILKPGGLAIMLTPDWEANYKIFFDDVTHVTPFTKETMRQALELAGMECVSATTFRQLPVTWRYPLVDRFSALISPFVQARTQVKFLRWSRELMLCGVGRRI